MNSQNNQSFGKCGVCENQAKSRCAGCFQVFYCSVEHQRKDWPDHKSNCSPIRVCHNEKVGRYYVATRNIKPGEIVLRESPLVLGPSQATPPVCVGCLQELHEKRYVECERCGWPVCKRECQDAPRHLQNECKLTVERGDKVSIKNFVSPHPTYSCLLITRCLMLKEDNPKAWKKLLELQSTLENEKTIKPDESGVENTAKFIQRFFKTNKWSEEEILKVNGIARINGHEVPLTNPSCVAIYHRASLFEHSCRPNLSKSFSNHNEVLLWAPNAIKANEHLTISYTDVLWGTQNRRFHLQQTKNFDCDCERCNDVTEFQTFMSSLNCLKCNEGFITPKSLSEWKNDWICTKCSIPTTFEGVMKIVDHAGKDLVAMDKEVENNCVKYLNYYSKWLSPNHFLLVEVKISLAQIIGAGVNGINRVNEDRLAFKAKTCKELIEVIERVAPNEARILGLIKFELHSVYAEWGRRALQVKDINCKALLEKSVEDCNDAIRLLKNEAESLPEGAICKQARINASSLLTMIGGLIGVGL